MNPTPLRSKRLVPIRRIGMLTAALVMVSASIGSPALAADPDEIAPEMEEAGLANVRLFAVEGPFWCLHNFDEHWSEEAKRAQLLRFLRAIESDRAMLGMSAHILAVGHKGR